MNIVHRGVIMAVYVFIVIVIYLVVSSPFDTLMTSFDNVNSTASDAEVGFAVGYGRTVFDIIFGAFIIIPLLWFIVSMFSREPDWRM